jgi:hypothetical protein
MRRLPLTQRRRSGRVPHHPLQLLLLRGHLHRGAIERAEKREDERHDEKEEEELRERNASADREDQEHQHEQPDHVPSSLRLPDFSTPAARAGNA